MSGLAGAGCRLRRPLWDGDPAQVWEAAERLTRSGLGRQRVLEHLARAWRKHGPRERADLESGRPDERSAHDAYLAALVRLGR